MFSVVVLVVKIILRFVYLKSLVVSPCAFVNFADFILSVMNLSISGSDFSRFLIANL
jgi:hypothetical protein